MRQGQSLLSKVKLRKLAKLQQKQEAKMLAKLGNPSLRNNDKNDNYMLKRDNTSSSLSNYQNVTDT